MRKDSVLKDDSADRRGCYHFATQLGGEQGLGGTTEAELQNRVHQFNSGRGLHPYNQ